jgi:hypothetical protein
MRRFCAAPLTSLNPEAGDSGERAASRPAWVEGSAASASARPLRRRVIAAASGAGSTVGVGRSAPPSAATAIRGLCHGRVSVARLATGGLVRPGRGRWTRPDGVVRQRPEQALQPPPQRGQAPRQDQRPARLLPPSVRAVGDLDRGISGTFP